MSLLDKIGEKLAGAVGWLILKELRGIRHAIEVGVDSQREGMGLRPIFAEAEAAPRAELTATDGVPHLAGERGADQPEPDGEFLLMSMLEALAEEQRVPVDSRTDLIALGKERGWLDQAGELVMLPQALAESPSV